MRISVIGAGAWGTALARLSANRDHETMLWAYEPELVHSIKENHVNELFLSGVELPRSLSITNDLEEAAREAEIVLTAVPSRHLRAILNRIAPHVDEEALFVSATKGLEEKTLLRMSQVIGEVLRSRFEPRLVVLSGPTFAAEVARDLPTALVAASDRADLARKVQQELSSLMFRIYVNDDVVGVELGGAVKNVIAIASGVSAGLGLGHNAVAALITRGLAELSRLSAALGGRRETLAGLAGLGDLVLTCTGDLSRNRTLGYELGRGTPLPTILSSMRTVAEGVPTTHATVALARRHGVDMPITFQMERLLRGDTTPEMAIEELMSRRLKEE